MAVRDLIFTILGIDKASKTLNAVGDSIDRMATRGSKSLAVFAGSSAASSIAVAGAVAAIPLAFAGIGAAALTQNAAVRGAFANLGQTVRTGAAQDARVLQDEYVSAAQEIGHAYTELRPLFREAFAASGPAVESLTRGVIGFARNAMPGAVTAVRSSGPVFAGLRDLLESTGQGLGDFLRIASEGAPDAGRGLRAFGDLAQGVLPEVGELLVDLTALWAEHGDQAVRVIVNLIGTAQDLGSHALPIVSDAMGVALDVLEGVLAVVGPLADQLGPLIGMWLSLALALRLVGSTQSAITGAVGAVNNLRQGMSEAGGGTGMGRFTTGLRGAMGLIGGPWGAAITAGIILLGVFGQQSQDAAATQRSLATALRESHGAFDANASRAFAASDSYKGVADEVERAGLSHREFIGALAKGGPELDALKQRLEDQVNAGEKSRGSGRARTTTYTDEAEAAKTLLVQTDGLRSSIVGAEKDFRREQEAIYGAGTAMTEAVPGTEALREAQKTLGDATATTADRADALNTAWRSLFGISLDLADATAKFEEGIDQLHEMLTVTENGVRTFDRAVVGATGSIDLGTAKGRELHASLTDQGNAYRSLAQSAYDTAIRQGKSHVEATAIMSRATGERRAQFAEELRVAGLTKAQVEALTRTYFGLPNQIMTTVTANTAPAENAIARFVMRNDGRTVALTVTGRQVGMAFRADGGSLVPGQWTMTGEEGPEIIVPDRPGMVLPAQHTRQILAALDRGIAPSAMGSRLVAAGSGAAPTVINLYAGVIGSQRELQNWLAGAVDDLKRKGRM